VKAAGQMIYKALILAWDGAWVVWLSELLWLVLSLFIITAPAAAGGMYYTMKELAYGESIDWKTFFRGVKKCFWASYRWAGFNLIAVGLLVFYAWFFSAAIADWGQLLSGIPLGLFTLWAVTQTFTFPLMLEQEKPSYRSALRNSLVIFLKWPGYALGIVLFNAVILGLSIWLRFPWGFLTFSLTALVACYGLKEKLAEAAIKEKPDPEGIR
jgi:hypothetical protein